uniref:Phospholipase A(2) n=1 Tax=Haemonchus placei TaxID=6290 RepID=A0A0N4WNY7_HAEPC
LTSSFSLPCYRSSINIVKVIDDDGESWECGTDAFSKYISENQIELDCPHLKKSVNGCCIKHDKCYDDQMGRKFCDDTFCSCLDVRSDVCNNENGPLFCGMVRQFGLEAYLRSGNNTSSNITLIIEEQQQVRSRAHVLKGSFQRLISKMYAMNNKRCSIIYSISPPSNC